MVTKKEKFLDIRKAEMEQDTGGEKKIKKKSLSLI